MRQLISESVHINTCGEFGYINLITTVTLISVNIAGLGSPLH